MRETCKVVMLSTEKASNIHLGMNRLFTTTEPHNNNPDISKGQHLYILSNDAVKDPLYTKHYVSISGNDIRFLGQMWKYERGCINGMFIENCKEVIASTDKSLGLPLIPESFIKAYIKAYNEDKPITEIQVETERWDNGNMDGWKYRPKTREDNTIIIHQAKTYTRDEIRNLCYGAFMAGYSNGSIKIDNIQTIVDEWIEENL